MGKPNVIWITLDSIRWDRTTLGGHHRDTTPNLAALASRDSTTTGKCTSHAIWSFPSVASILTGTYPSRHGAGLGNDSLPTSLRTIPERFSEAGYHTVGRSLNPWVTEARGLARGFADFRWMNKQSALRRPPLKGLARLALGQRSHSCGLFNGLSRQKPEILFHEEVRSQIQSIETTDKPVYMYAHYQGAHHPYNPPKKFWNDFTDELDVSPDRAADTAYHRSKDVHEEIANYCSFSDDEWAALKAMYDAEIRYIDMLVSELVEDISSLGPTFLVITSDHGEFLGEYDILSHMLAVDNPVTAVPLAIHGSGVESIDFEVPIQHGDVHQTILSRVGGDTEGMDSINVDKNCRQVALTERGEKSYSDHLENILKYNPEFEVEIPEEHTRFLTSETNSARLVGDNPNTDTVKSNLLNFYHDLKEQNALLREAGTAESEVGEDVEAQLEHLGYR